MALTDEEIDVLDTDTLRKLVRRCNEWTCGEDCPCSQGDGFVCNEWKEYARMHGLDRERDKKEYDMEYFFFRDTRCQGICALEYELWKIRQKESKHEDKQQA